jgi:hypothetical protein
VLLSSYLDFELGWDGVESDSPLGGKVFEIHHCPGTGSRVPKEVRLCSTALVVI